MKVSCSFALGSSNSPHTDKKYGFCAIKVDTNIIWQLYFSNISINHLKINKKMKLLKYLL